MVVATDEQRNCENGRSLFLLVLKKSLEITWRPMPDCLKREKEHHWENVRSSVSEKVTSFRKKFEFRLPALDPISKTDTRPWNKLYPERRYISRQQNILSAPPPGNILKAK